MKIFNIIFFAILCALPVAARATEECPFFSPALALCSVHAYNVGDAQNPTDVGRIAEIEEVIGLKSTVMVQQLKQQYDALNAVIKRFKTQLNKAVLTSKIEVLTGNTSSSSNSSSGGSSSNNNGLANANDCSFVEYDNVFDCLMGNLQKIQMAADTDITNARKQLEKDWTIINNYKMCTNGTGTNKQQIDCTCNNNRVQLSNMNSTLRSKADLTSCATYLYQQVNVFKSSQRNQNNNRTGWGNY